MEKFKKYVIGAAGGITVITFLVSLHSLFEGIIYFWPKIIFVFIFGLSITLFPIYYDKEIPSLSNKNFKEVMVFASVSGLLGAFFLYLNLFEIALFIWVVFGYLVEQNLPQKVNKKA